MDVLDENKLYECNPNDPIMWINIFSIYNSRPKNNFISRCPKKERVVFFTNSNSALTSSRTYASVTSKSPRCSSFQFLPWFYNHHHLKRKVVVGHGMKCLWLDHRALRIFQSLCAFFVTIFTGFLNSTKYKKIVIRNATNAFIIIFSHKNHFL